MSNIVDIGISQGGISSTVPEQIPADQLDDVELFLTKDERDLVEKTFTGVDAAGVRTFAGTDAERDELEGPMGEAEMLVYQLNQGIEASQFAESLGNGLERGHVERGSGGGPPADERPAWRHRHHEDHQ